MIIFNSSLRLPGTKIAYVIQYVYFKHSQRFFPIKAFTRSDLKLVSKVLNIPLSLILSDLHEDLGTNNDDSCNYPDCAHKIAKDVSSGKKEIGILICTSGQGMVITANKHRGVRAALCWNDEISRLARAHNNANVLCLPANFIVLKDAIRIIESFL